MAQRSRQPPGRAAGRVAAEAALKQLLGEWQQARGYRSFGVCNSCRHFFSGTDIA
jgi:hypothetical protein